jgi:alkanesulfonate monooxygenase SsuD/methylene tetrahydromethanopterin reductase-like flavin-dependent oxidoreductase (luciferase family)
MSPGQWRDPDDKPSGKDCLPYWSNLARLAEEGKISFIFFADSYSLMDIYAGSTAAILKAGAHSASLDPMVVIPAMASVTKSLGFGVTGSTSYLNPFILARDVQWFGSFD